MSNAPSEIIRMFNSAFNAFGNADVGFYPKVLRKEIDTINPTGIVPQGPELDFLTPHGRETIEL